MNEYFCLNGLKSEPTLAVLLAAMLIGLLMLTRKPLHYFQLESYQFHGYFKTVIRQWKRLFGPLAIYNLTFIGLILLNGLINNTKAVSIGCDIVSAALLLYCAFVLSKKVNRGKEKKPFVLTGRVKRLCGVICLIFMALMLLCLLTGSLVQRAVSLIFPIIMPFTIALCALIALPIEKFINHLYLKDAEKKLLSNDRLIRIGITGSYGKTSTKFVLATILSQKYNVLATPASFNTPMGLTRVIREQLMPSHHVFIGEMGARHNGEIKELCDLVHPTIGILTSIGPQHLDTFHSIENIEKTKYAIIESLPQDGLGVFSDDQDRVTKLYHTTQKPKMLIGAEGSDAWAEDVRTGSFGSTFTLCLKNGTKFPVTTRLLGEHNIRNILVASAVAKYLGLSIRQIEAGISALEPVEHRMKIVSDVGGVTVIDDAFNTNPRSSKEALKILRSFEGRKIIITPGMVELGENEAKYNHEFGCEIAKSADIALLIGAKHAEPIRHGLIEAGFKQENLYVFDDFQKAVALVNQIKTPGDVIIYENDLPDNYSE